MRRRRVPLLLALASSVGRVHSVRNTILPPSNPWYDDRIKRQMLFEHPVQDGGSKCRDLDCVVVRGDGRACDFFVWNLPGAIMYKWCRHLMKGNTIEGKGGKKFVRYEANSFLETLYPCSRYSPSRCLICGGELSDHMLLSWTKRHLHSPYDLYMDKTYDEALELPDDGERVVNERRTQFLIEDATVRRRKRRTEGGRRLEPSSNRSSRRKEYEDEFPAPSIHNPSTFSFHKRYVMDVSHWLDLAPRNIRMKVRALPWFRKGPIHVRGVEARSKIAYAVPAVPDSMKRPSFALKVLRQVCLSSLDSLLLLQEAENEKRRTPWDCDLPKPSFHCFMQRTFNDVGGR